MATQARYRKQYLKWHGTYEKRATKEVRKAFKTWTKRIDWNELQAGTYKSMINIALNKDILTDAYVKMYYEIGRVHGRRVVSGINLSLKTSLFEGFLSLFTKNVAKYIRLYGAKRITSVRQTFFEYIIELIANRLDKEQDMREVAKQIQKEVNRPDFYRWQAERIARTESTAASNYAAIQAGESSNFEMVKEWISATDKRTRRKPQDEFDHLEMNGKQVGLKEKFMFNGGEDALEYPGDPTGEASNIINCRCTVSVVAKRDRNGNLIPKI